MVNKAINSWFEL